MTIPTRDEVIVQPSSEAFGALAQVVRSVTGRQIDAQRDPTFLDEYSAPSGYISIPNNDVEGLFHELCHWIVAGDLRRHLNNYGLDPRGPGWRGSIQEEICCGWIEADVYARAGVQMPQSSVLAERYWDFPRWRPVALSRWQRYTSWSDRAGVVEALRLTGGDVGLWSPS